MANHDWHKHALVRSDTCSACATRIPCGFLRFVCKECHTACHLDCLEMPCTSDFNLEGGNSTKRKSGSKKASASKKRKLLGEANTKVHIDYIVEPVPVPDLRKKVHKSKGKIEKNKIRLRLRREQGDSDSWNIANTTRTTTDTASTANKDEGEDETPNSMQLTWMKLNSAEVKKEEEEEGGEVDEEVAEVLQQMNNATSRLRAVLKDKQKRIREVQAEKEFYHDMLLKRDAELAEIRKAGSASGGKGTLQKLSKELADIIGRPEASEKECYRVVVRYIETNNLQDPDNNSYFNPDSKLIPIFKHRTHMLDVLRLLNSHMS